MHFAKHINNVACSVSPFYISYIHIVYTSGKYFLFRDFFVCAKVHLNQQQENDKSATLLRMTGEMPIVLPSVWELES